jgi:hypothetical protein
MGERMHKLTVWMALAGGCSRIVEGAPPETLASDLRFGTSCGDLTLVVSDAASLWSLVIEGAGLVAAARDIDDVVNYGWRMPGAVRAALVELSPVNARECGPFDDAIGGANQSMEAVDGEINLVVTPRSTPYSTAHVELDVRALVLEGLDTPAFRLDTLTLDVELPPE